jgi:hypothetical protein
MTESFACQWKIGHEKIDGLRKDPDASLKKTEREGLAPERSPVAK